MKNQLKGNDVDDQPTPKVNVNCKNSTPLLIIGIKVSEDLDSSYFLETLKECVADMVQEAMYGE